MTETSPQGNALREDQVLAILDQARVARCGAYCPYSGFAVGAAVLTADGSVFTGCNIENSAYSETICAERVAIWKAVSEGQREIIGLAVVAAGREPPRPCGACLQVIAELAPGMTICLGTLDGKRSVVGLGEFLPRPFRLRPPADHPAGGGRP
jgi:cytidine deaminase